MWWWLLAFACQTGGKSDTVDTDLPVDTDTAVAPTDSVDALDTDAVDSDAIDTIDPDTVDPDTVDTLDSDSDDSDAVGTIDTDAVDSDAGDTLDTDAIDSGTVDTIDPDTVPIDPDTTDTVPIDTATVDTTARPFPDCVPGVPTPGSCYQGDDCLYIPGPPPDYGDFEADYREAYNAYWADGGQARAAWTCADHTGRQLNVLWLDTGEGFFTTMYDAVTGEIVALHQSSDVGQYCWGEYDGWYFEVIPECDTPPPGERWDPCISCGPNALCGQFDVDRPLGVDRPLPDPDASPPWLAGPLRQCVPTCGNGTLEAPEQCDDGNRANEDGCNAVCMLDCGNRWVEPMSGEQCDDGNRRDGDGCSALCAVEDAPPTCGDGAIDADEACDDANLIAGDGCAPDCRDECGDDQMQLGEACEDGNADPFDGCDAYCIPECGNGTVEPQETCDDGGLLPEDGCDAQCMLECGNGRHDAPEVCDDGNRVSGDGCSATCTDECGDGALGANEACDRSVPGTLGCSPYCTFACGDGEVDWWEHCDDGDNDPHDGCDQCNARVHGIVAAGTEVCGLSDNGDVLCWGDARTLPAGPWDHLVATETGTCAVSAAGDASCWGLRYSQDLIGPYLDVAIHTYTRGGTRMIEPTTLNLAGEVSFGTTPQPQFGAGNTRVLRDQAGGLVFNATTGVAQSTVVGGNSSPPGVRLIDVAYERFTQCGLADTGEVVCWATLAGPTPAAAGRLHRPRRRALRRRCAHRRRSPHLVGHPRRRAASAHAYRRRLRRDRRGPPHLHPRRRLRRARRRLPAVLRRGMVLGRRSLLLSRSSDPAQIRPLRVDHKAAPRGPRHDHPHELRDPARLAEPGRSHPAGRRHRRAVLLRAARPGHRARLHAHRHAADADDQRHRARARHRLGRVRLVRPQDEDPHRLHPRPAARARRRCRLPAGSLTRGAW